MTSTYDIAAAPVNHLPMDVLHEIFSYILPTDSTIFIGNKAPTDLHINYPLNALTEVCTHWGNIIESASSAIWARIILDLDDIQGDSAIYHILEKVRKCVLLSKNRRLSFAAKGTTPLDARAIAKALIHVMTTSSSRLVSLKVDCLMGPLDLEFRNWTVGNGDGINQLKEQSFPILEELELLWGCEDSVTHNLYPFEEVWRVAHILTLFDSTPNLRNVTLDSLRPLFYNPDSDINMPWTNIKQLKIVNIHSYKAYLHYASIFLDMPELEALELSFVESSPGFYWDGSLLERDSGDSHFNNLRKLKITTFTGRSIQQVSDHHVFDAEYILGTIPYARTLEYIFLQRIPCNKDQDNGSIELIEDPVMDYLHDSECDGFNIVEGKYHTPYPYYDVFGEKDDAGSSLVSW